MKKILIVIAGLVLSLAGRSQKVRGSIQQGSSPNAVNIIYQPDHNSVAGEFVNYLSVSIAIPTSQTSGLVPAIASAGIFSPAITFTPAVPFSYTVGTETIYSWICPNNTAFTMSWKNGVSFVGAIITFSGTDVPSNIRMIDFTKEGKGGINQNTAFNVGVNVSPFDMTDYQDFFFRIDGENGSTKGIYSNGDKFVETHLSKNIVANAGIPATLSIGGLFPNPASTIVNVIINAPESNKLTLLVTDIGGKTVKQQLVNVEAGSNSVPVEISKLAQGSYLVKVICKSDCETTTAKFNKL